MGNVGRNIIKQKIGQREMITQDFVRQVKNFINNFDVTGGNMRFDGVRARLTVDGGGGGGGAFQDHPFRVYRNDDGATERVSMKPGTMNLLVPSDIHLPVNITASGVEYVYIKMTFSGGSTTRPNVLEWGVQSAHPAISATTPESPPTEVYDVIAVLIDGAVSQIRYDNVTATSTFVLEEEEWDNAIGEFLTTPYYRWEIG